MKIWYQMGGTYRYEDFYNEFGQRVEERCRQVVRPDTEVYVIGLPKMEPKLAQYKFIEYYHKNQILNNMYRAKKEGFDAFVIAFPMDGGLAEGREILDIPVVGIFQSACLMAAMMGYRFTAITGSEYLCERYRQMAEQYGFGSRYLSNNYWFPAPREEAYHSYDKTEAFKEKFIPAARRAIADGASVLLPFSNGVLSMAYASGLTKTGVDGVPVLDAVSIALKQAEMLVDLKPFGIHASRKPQVYGHPDDEILKRTLETYGSHFYIDREG